MKLLLVEDNKSVRITVRDALEEAGYEVVDCDDGSAGLRALEQSPFDILLTDVRLPGVDGLTLFRKARELQPDAAVVLMTAFGQTEDAVKVMREGARDYVLKPFEMEELLLRLGRVRTELSFRRQLGAANATKSRGLIRGESLPFRRLHDRLIAAAETDVAVLVQGETGTGKDLCARAIHEQSRRAQKPMVIVNCAAIPETLIEAELFGHERGAFTGADRKRVGRFEAANGGTLFLDEVGELSAAAQAKLLRVLESSAFEPVGSNKAVKVDVRIIAATNRDLLADVARGSFRKDLYYRLAVIDIRTPPLRECRSDIPLLVSAFLGDIAARQGKPVPQVDASAAAVLAAHDFPGNVRELLHALERAVALARGGELRVEHLPPDMITDLPESTEPAAAQGVFAPLDQALGQFERQYIQQALAKTGGQRTRAAELLGISRKSLWERLREITHERD